VLRWSRFLEFTKKHQLSPLPLSFLFETSDKPLEEEHFHGKEHAKHGIITSFLENMAHTHSFGELKSAVKHVFHGFKHVIEHGSEMNEITLEYAIVENLNKRGLVSDEYLTELKAKLDTKKKGKITEFVDQLTKSSG
jgi:hypothetical protein